MRMQSAYDQSSLNMWSNNCWIIGQNNETQLPIPQLIHTKYTYRNTQVRDPILIVMKNTGQPPNWVRKKQVGTLDHSKDGTN